MCPEFIFIGFKQTARKDREQFKLLVVSLHCSGLLNLAFFCFVHLEAAWIVVRSNPSLNNLFL